MRILIFLLLLAPQWAFAIKNYSLGQTLNVLALKGLNLRDRPHGDKVVRTLPYGSQVVVAEKPNQDYPFEADGIKGFWVKVRVGEQTTGYVFDGFLSALPAPDASCSSLQDYCRKHLRAFAPRTVKNINQWLEFGQTMDWVQAYEYQNKIFALVENNSPYGSFYELVLPGASLEEAWLIARACLKDELESAKAMVAARTINDDNGLAVQQKHYDQFAAVVFRGFGCVALPLAGIDRYLGLNEADGAVSITVSKKQ